MSIKRAMADTLFVPELGDDPTQPGPWLNQTALQQAQATLQSMNKEQLTTHRQVMAVRLTQLGCVVVPGTEGEKRPISSWKKIKQTSAATTFTTDQMGILTGPSGLCVVDIDVKDQGVSAWNLLVRLLDLTRFIQEQVPFEMTTTGGFHFYFKNPASGPLPSRAKMKIHHQAGQTTAVGIDVRGHGGYIRCCPSAHIGDLSDAVTPYITWVRGPTKQNPFPELPPALERILRQEDVICAQDDGSYTIRPARQVPHTTTKRQRVDPLRPVVHVDPAAPIAMIPPEDPTVRRLVMECLSHQRAEVYDDWLRVLFALAHEDHKDQQEDRYLQLCKDFSRRTRRNNLSSDEKIAQLYGKAWGDAGQQPRPTTLGTIKQWAREDNPQLYAQLTREAREEKQQPVAPNTFDDSDYYWHNFCQEATSQVWPTYSAFVEFCVDKLPTVLAIISRTPHLFVSKHSEDERFNMFERLNKMYSFPFCWAEGVNPDGTPKIHTMDFARFVERERLKFPSFKQVDVDPAGKKDPHTVFNIWPGMRARLLHAYDEAKIRPFQELLKIWSHGEDATYQYLLAWFKLLVAEPHRKAGVALVVTGLEGTGKSVVCEFLRDFVLGSPITAFFDGVEDMTEKHNCRKAGKRLWVLEECRSSRDEFIHNMDSLKRLITNPVVSENPKGMPIREVENIGMMIILSNHVDCIHVTTTDRRYSFIPTSPERRGAEHRPWWAELRKQLLQQETGDHVYTWLLSLEDLPDPTLPLQNAMRTQVQQMSKPAELQYVEARLAAIQDTYWWISKANLYQGYTRWCHDHGHKIVLNASRFHGKVKQIAAERQELNFKAYRHCHCHGYAPHQVIVAEVVVQGLWGEVDYNVL